MGPLLARTTGDGSFSLFSPEVGEGFHSAEGAQLEARRVFVRPSALERFEEGRPITVVEVCVGTSTNTCALTEAASRRRLELQWWGLERDPCPLELALADAGFRRQWPQGVAQQAEGLCRGPGLLWGDARRRLPELLERLEGRCDLVWLDAFSPQRTPELWTVEFLGGLARLLAPAGRLLTYSSAAAVRRVLQDAGLRLAAIRSPQAGAATAPLEGPPWSGGTAASPSPLAEGAHLRSLSAMEREHMASRAGEPYRDPSGLASAKAIQQERREAQERSGAESGSAWQRRWSVARHR